MLRAGAQITAQKIAPTGGKAKEKKEKEKDDSEARVTTAESSGIHPRSAPKQVAKEKAGARAQPREKEERGKWTENKKTGT